MDGPVFHLLRHEAGENFASARERGMFRGRDECLRAALSCFVSIDPARRLLETSPEHFRAIARADLTPAHGTIRHTPNKGQPEHYSLWLRAEYLGRCPDLFVEVQ